MAPILHTATVGDVLCLYERELLAPSKLRILRDSLNRMLYPEPTAHTERLEEYCLFGEIKHGKAWCIEWQIHCFRVVPVELGDAWRSESDRVVWEEAPSGIPIEADLSKD